MAQAGCAVDSPIVALNLKGEKEDRGAGRRWRGEKTVRKKDVEAVKYSAGVDGLTVWS